MSATKSIEYAAQAVKAGNLLNGLTLLLIAQIEDPENQTLNKAIQALERQIGERGNLLSQPAAQEQPDSGLPAFSAEETAWILHRLVSSQAQVLRLLEQLANTLEGKSGPFPTAPPAVQPARAVTPMAGGESQVPAPSSAGTGGQTNLSAEINTLQAWLTDRNIEVTSQNLQLLSNQVYCRLATMLGSRYELLTELYSALKRSVSSGHTFTINLNKESQETIASVTQFCNSLYSVAFLEYYNYDRNSRQIKGSVPRSGEIINFLNGGWLEIYIASVVKEALDGKGVPYQTMHNPKIVFGNGDTFELDLLYLVEGEPLWIECKTGDFQNYVQRYQQTRAALGIPIQRSILIILDLNENKAAELNSLYRLRFTGLAGFKKCLAEAIGNGNLSAALPPRPAAQPNPPLLSVGATQLLTILNKKNLRPLPEHRQEFLTQLVALFSQNTNPLTITVIKDELATQVNISKSKIQDLMNALLYGRAFLRPDGNPVVSFTEPIQSLISSDTGELEKICIASYLEAFLDSGYAITSPQQIHDVEQLIGGKLPAV